MMHLEALNEPEVLQRDACDLFVQVNLSRDPRTPVALPEKLYDNGQQ
jgi:hypothetical protein